VAEADATYRHRGTRAIARMVEFAPSTGGLALWVKHQDVPASSNDTSKTPLISTDGNTVFYAPAFEQLPLAEQVGQVAHEVLHIALRHPQRYLDLKHLIGDVSLPLFNTCADAIVNSTLSHVSWLQLPAGAVQLDRLLKAALDIDQPVTQSLLQWDVESLYRAVDDRRAPPPSGKGRGPRDPGGTGQSGSAPSAAASQNAKESNRSTSSPGRRAARVLALGSTAQADLVPGTATHDAPESEAELAQLWSERIVRAHAGDGAHSMWRSLLADLPKTRTPWEQVLRTQLARGLANEPELSWSRPSRSYLANQGRMGPHRRMPFEPGSSPNRAVPRLILVVDVSGSIDDALMQRFAREIEAIARRLAAGVTLIVGDDQVRHIERFAPGHCDLAEIEFKGGGGTDFGPLLEEAARHQPDITVVLTDLDGPAHYRPRCPVLWAVPLAFAGAVLPFGRKLVLS
jgi:predicted metal-dependent peptidase